MFENLLSGDLSSKKSRFDNQRIEDWNEPKTIFIILINWNYLVR